MGCQSIAGLPPGLPPALNSPVLIYTPEWRRSTARVSYLVQEPWALSAARARTRTARSRVESTNHEATAPPYIVSLSFLSKEDSADFHRLLEYFAVCGNIYAYLLRKTFNILNIVLINFVLVASQLIYEIRKYR